ncbi:zf-HC2 domain-containing protein [Tenacibaculum sp. 190130A14a]|uniref:Zf-HC2 domain-containing protein n=1 Tax=Tenacibaculum polynesiense TaxID=3137857 RepID=A0ABP1EW70_9FLAO
MDCNQIQDKLIDYIEKQLSQDEMNTIETHLESCNSCKEELEHTRKLLSFFSSDSMEVPSKQLKANFEKMLHEEIEKQGPKVIPIRSNTPWKTYIRIAASILIVISAYLIGQQSSNHNSSNIKEQQVLALLENQSASKRILAVSQAEEFNNNDTQIINALIQKLFNDKNVNVRLAAAEALAKFSSLESVRQALIKSLETEKVPTMQIELIQILARIQEKRALDPMKKLLDNDETPTYVKQQLEYNIASLF